MSDAEKLREAMARAMCDLYNGAGSFDDEKQVWKQARERWLKGADAALAAMHAAGFRIVPEAPTKKMIDEAAAAAASLPRQFYLVGEPVCEWRDQIEAACNAMLAAAPKVTP